MRRSAQVLERAPLPLETSIHIALGILDGLGAAHAKGIIHRDLKPGNVMVTESGAKILDFGLSRTVTGSVCDKAPTLTIDGAVMGTPAYMSPEQFTGSDVDARSDIFSFGLVLYEMATGKRAFAGTSAPQIMTAIMRDMPPPPRTVNPQVPPGLERIILTCIQKAPEQRYQTAREIASELKQISTGSFAASSAVAQARLYGGGGRRGGSRGRLVVALTSRPGPLEGSSRLQCFHSTICLEIRHRISSPTV